MTTVLNIDHGRSTFGLSVLQGRPGHGAPKPDLLFALGMQARRKRKTKPDEDEVYVYERGAGRIVKAALSPGGLPAYMRDTLLPDLGRRFGIDVAVVEGVQWHHGGANGQRLLDTGTCGEQYAEMVRCVLGLEPMRPMAKQWRRSVLAVRSSGSAEKIALDRVGLYVPGWNLMTETEGWAGSRSNPGMECTRGHVAESICQGVYGLRETRRKVA